MVSLPEKFVVADVLNRILSSSERVLKRAKSIKRSSDFLASESSLERLDSIWMQLIAIGESIKNLDKLTKGKFLVNYPEFEWKKAMGMRDIISHHYFDLNSEIVFDVCKNEIPKLKKAISGMLKSFGENWPSPGRAGRE